VRRLLAVMVKEVRQIRRDPLSLLMLIAFPAFMLILYGFALNFDVRHIVERRVARAVLVVPEGFGRDLAAGRRAVVQLLLDGADSTTAATVLGYARLLVSEANADLVGEALSHAGRRLSPPLELAPRILYNPELESTRFLVPGLIGLLLMVTAVLSTALSVVREKERGTMEQLRVAPLRTYELILGKTLPYLGISLLGTLIVLATARLLFGVEIRGSHLELLVVVLLYLFGALGFGLLISTIANSQTFAFQVGLITSLLPVLLLSGFIFQIRIMPVGLQAITYLIPARYFLVALRGIILKGEGLATYWEQVAALVVYGLVVIALASARLARREH
jgi:ABC-2 type transport system permease protein